MRYVKNPIIIEAYKICSDEEKPEWVDDERLQEVIERYHGKGYLVKDQYGTTNIWYSDTNIDDMFTPLSQAVEGLGILDRVEQGILFANPCSKDHDGVPIKSGEFVYPYDEIIDGPKEGSCAIEVMNVVGGTIFWTRGGCSPSHMYTHKVPESSKKVREVVG